MSFTDRLKEYREKTGLNQKDFAKQAGIPQLVYNRIETGKRQPDMKNLIAVRKRFGINLNELLLGENLDSAGQGIPLYSEEDLLDSPEQRVAQQWVAHPDVPEHCFAFRVQDNSNHPLLSYNDIVFIEDEKVEAGNLVLCRDRTGSFVIRRLVCPSQTADEGQGHAPIEYLLAAEDREYEMMALEGSDIIGKVIAFIKVTNIKC